MRPLRCSRRLGFQGTSKWNRSQQWVWRLMPSRRGVGGDQDAQRVLASGRR